MVKVVMIWIKMVMIINQDQDDGDQDEVLHFLFLINHPLSGPSGDRPTCTTRHACQRRCHKTFVHRSRTACSSPQLSMSTSSSSLSFSSPNDSSPPEVDIRFGRESDFFFYLSIGLPQLVYGIKNLPRFTLGLFTNLMITILGERMVMRVMMMVMRVFYSWESCLLARIWLKRETCWVPKFDPISESPSVFEFGFPCSFIIAATIT